MATTDVHCSKPLLDIHVGDELGEGLPRIIYIRDFGGFGNDAVSVAAPDLSSTSGRAAAGMALRAAFSDLNLPRPMAIQVGCVPAECESEVRSIIEEHFECGLSFVGKMEARRFTAPIPSQVPVPPDGEELRLEQVNQLGHELETWLAEALAPRGYPRCYIDYLIASEAVVAPFVAVNSAGKAIGMVLQEASDLSLGALHVDENMRGKGVGTWLLNHMSNAIFEKHGLAATSMVEPDNDISKHLHLRANWSMDDEPLVWLAFT